VSHTEDNFGAHLTAHRYDWFLNYSMQTEYETEVIRLDPDYESLKWSRQHVCSCIAPLWAKQAGGGCWDYKNQFLAGIHTWEEGRCGWCC
jgi:hypothetical protein